VRIGIVAPEFPPDVGGIETYAYEISRELARRDHDVFVFTKPHIGGEVESRGIQVLPILLMKYKPDRSLPKNFKMDVWHVMNAAYAWLALETEPVVISVHGNDFINPYYLVSGFNFQRLPGLWRLYSRIRPFERRLARLSTRRLIRRGLSQSRQVITNSQYTKTLLIKHYPTCREKASIGWVGVGNEFLQMRHDRPASATLKRFVTVCRLAEPRKNVDRVLRALAELKQYSFTYTIVGGGNLRPRLEALCCELGLEDRVKFTGYLAKPDIQDLLAQSDLFILTSSVLPGSVEGFGIVYLEANACGTPVLAARAAGAVEAVDEGKTGFFVEEPSIPAITRALQSFLKEEIQFESADCKAFASRFTWRRVVDHVSQYYCAA
jgi:phosphatidylinositol alpha-1,6-mannosyltransferase